ncbi:MAG: DUF4831 family protein [Paludibacteraceae bacterium]
MAKKSFIGLIVWLLVGTGCAAQTAVVAAADNAFAGNAVYYYLPQTELVIVADAVCTVQCNGPFYKYAERYLGITDVITAPTKEWRLQQVYVQAHAVRDEQKCYAVAVNKKTTACYLHTTDEGILAAVNVPITATSPSPQLPPPPSALCADTALTFDMTQLGEEVLVASSIPKMAELAAKQIYQIRESRTALLSGDNETLPDGVALEVMLKRLDAAEHELVALFVGKTITYSRTATYTVTPTAAMEREVLFRISSHEGLVAADNLIGEPIYLSVEIPKQTTHHAPVETVVPCGIVYNVPATAVVSVSDGVGVLTQNTIIMPQFGSVACLPAMFFDGKTTRVELTEYGALKSISQ